jgi:hypothetical protein
MESPPPSEKEKYDKQNDIVHNVKNIADHFTVYTCAADLYRTAPRKPFLLQGSMHFTDDSKKW